MFSRHGLSSPSVVHLIRVAKITMKNVRQLPFFTWLSRMGGQGWLGCLTGVSSVNRTGPTRHPGSYSRKCGCKCKHSEVGRVTVFLTAACVNRAETIWLPEQFIVSLNQPASPHFLPLSHRNQTPDCDVSVNSCHNLQTSFLCSNKSFLQRPSPLFIKRAAPVNNSSSMGEGESSSCTFHKIAFIKLHTVKIIHNS